MPVTDADFRALADNLPTLCWIADGDGSIVWQNRRWYEYTGSGPEETLGWGWRAVHDPQVLPDVLERWSACIGEARPFDMVCPLKGADGVFRSFLTRVSPHRDGDGRVERWFGVHIDVDETKREEEERSLVANELSHRIRNIFSVVSGLIHLSARNFPEAGGFAGALRERVDALARAHDFVRPHSELSRPKTRSTTLFNMLGDLLAPYQDADRIVVSGEDIVIDDWAATPLALVFHELATNAAKYGALSVAGGRVAISGAAPDGAYAVTWSESGGPPVTAPSRTGFGSNLARISAERQLGGKIVPEWRQDGLVVTLTVPPASMNRA